jgi:iron complex outermembrane recepter protein
MSALCGKSPAAAGTKMIACALLLAFSTVGTLRAQHASDDPVASANDGFGLTLGLESIGLYGPGFVRGFNPQTAGDARIDGLYFDQQGLLSNRVVEGSTIRIGVSEIGYAFPAPTGIVDYDLRHAGNGTPSATIVASAGPFQARGVSIDGNLPLISSELQLPMGASYQLSTQTQISTPNPGYTSTVANFGATPQWKPTDQLTFRGIFDRTQTTNAKTLPIVLTAGDYLPPDTPRGYFGQNWAEGRSLSENYGGIVTARLSRDWSFAAGIFRSVADNPVSLRICTSIRSRTAPPSNTSSAILTRRPRRPPAKPVSRVVSEPVHCVRTSCCWPAAATRWRCTVALMLLIWARP